MMTDDEFWEQIESLGGTINKHAAEQLAARLSAESPDRITGFADRLAEAVYALDSPDRADQEVIDPTAGDDPISMSDDLFLYARCAVVAAGRARWQHVLNDPSAMAGRWPVFDGEWLLTVAPNAFEEATGHDWTHEPPLSVETGSNAENWPEDSTDTADGMLDDDDHESLPDDDYEPVATHRPWFEILGGKHQALPWRPTCQHVQNAYMIAINADREWTQWWGRSGRRDLEIRAWVGPAPAGAPQIKVGRKRVIIDMDVDGRFLFSLQPPASPATWPRRCRTDDGHRPTTTQLRAAPGDTFHPCPSRWPRSRPARARRRVTRGRDLGRLGRFPNQLGRTRRVAQHQTCT